MAATAIRFDTGKIRQHEITPEGYLRAEAVFARDGILEYKMPNGNVRREFRPPEENRKALVGFGLKPICFEHPPKLIDSQNAKDYLVGLSDSTVIYDKHGFVKGVIEVLNADTVEAIVRGDAVEISAGYECVVDPTPGVWQGQRYDAVQRDIKVNHIAVTRKGRAGEEVRIQMDSDNFAYQINENLTFQEIPRGAMAQIVLDSVTYDNIPETFASVVGAKITELEKSSRRIDSLEQELAQYKQQIAQLTDEKDTQEGRADGYEEIVDAAVPILQEHGYEWNANKVEFVLDAAKAKKPPMEEMEDMEDMEDEEDEEEMPPKKWHKHKKDSVAHVLETWKKAEVLGWDESKFDSDLSASQIHRQVLAEIEPNLDLTGLGESYIEGLFDGYYLQSLEAEEETIHGDSESLYSQNLQTMVQATRAIKSPGTTESSLSDAWQEPLALSL